MGRVTAPDPSELRERRTRGVQEMNEGVALEDDGKLRVTV